MGSLQKVPLGAGEEGLEVKGDLAKNLYARNVQEHPKNVEWKWSSIENKTPELVLPLGLPTVTDFSLTVKSTDIHFKEPQ